jgi:L-iditol 2-dehydrogenase
MRREMAAKFGADWWWTGRGEPAEVVKGRTGGLGVDCLILAIGVPAIVNDLLKLVRKGGR